MADRKLLEKAAKAGGLEIIGWRADHDGVSGQVEVALLRDGTFWQPLLKNRATDFMGDAHRLAVELKMLVDISDQGYTGVIVGGYKGDIYEGHFDDPAAATCRAIVRAAAIVWKE